MSSFKLEGHFGLRERLAISIFHKKEIQIVDIRKYSLIPGIRKFEVQLFSLIDKLIPGSIFKINQNGTGVKFYPGNSLEKKVVHYIGKYRSLSYYLEFILYISNLRHNTMEIKLSGLRSSTLDVSLESILYVTIPLHRKWGRRDMRIKVFSNAFSLLRNTELILICSKVKLEIKNGGRIVQPGILKKLRLIFSNSSGSFPSREIIKRFLQKNHFKEEIDFSFFTLKIPNQGLHFNSLMLVGQTSKGFLFGNDFSTNKKNLNHFFWKTILDQTFSFFFEDLKTGGCVDNRNQIFLLLKLIGEGKKQVSQIRMGKLTLLTILFFRDLKKFVGRTYRIYPSIDKKSLNLQLI